MKNVKLMLAIVLCTFTGAAFAEEGRTNLLATSLGYDIIKQGEKLEKDPSDIKETDLMKFKYVCRNPEFQRDIRKNSKQFRETVSKLCDTITDL